MEYILQEKAIVSYQKKLRYDNPFKNIVKTILLLPFYILLGFVWLIIMPFMVLGFTWAIIKYALKLFGV